GVDPAGRARVEHGAAADGRLRPDDHTVAARRDHGLLEPQLCEAAAPRDPRRYVGGAEVDGDRGRYLGELLERDVEAVGDGVGARRDERVAAREPVALDP